MALKKKNVWFYWYFRLYASGRRKTIWRETDLRVMTYMLLSGDKPNGWRSQPHLWKSYSELLPSWLHLAWCNQALVRSPDSFFLSNLIPFTATMILWTHSANAINLIWMTHGRKTQTGFGSELFSNIPAFWRICPSEDMGYFFNVLTKS